MARNWIDLSNQWETLAAAARVRDTQKAELPSTKNYSKHSTHFVGLLGEAIWCAETGQGLDLSYKPGGDDGFDFIWNDRKVDVKTTVYLSPVLKLSPGLKKMAQDYVLVYLDWEGKRGYLAGWATREEMLAAPLKEWKKGRPVHSLGLNQIHPGLPPVSRK